MCTYPLTEKNIGYKSHYRMKGRHKHSKLTYRIYISVNLQNCEKEKKANMKLAIILINNKFKYKLR